MVRDRRPPRHRARRREPGGRASSASTRTRQCGRRRYRDGGGAPGSATAVARVRAESDQLQQTLAERPRGRRDPGRTPWPRASCAIDADRPHPVGRMPPPTTCWAGHRGPSSAGRSSRPSWIPRPSTWSGPRSTSGAATGELRIAGRGRTGPRAAGAPVRERGVLARPRRRLGAATAPAHPGRVHRQPLARAAHAADHGQPARRDPRARSRARPATASRRGCATGSPRSRSRPAISSRWSTSCWTCRGSRAAARCSSSMGIDLGRSRPTPPSDCACSPSARAWPCTSRSIRALPTVRGDAARLGQVVVNLVHNAVKFSPDGGDVMVRARADGGEVIVSVEDHGVGIPRAAQDRVFERFYKVDRARLRAEAGGGTGLGLAIARHVIEQHGGRIWVESRGGRRVHVLVRRARPHRNPPRPPDAPPTCLPDHPEETHGSPARRDPQHPQPGGPLARTPAADPGRHGGAPARPAGAPGGRLRHAAGPPDRRGR